MGCQEYFGIGHKGAHQRLYEGTNNPNYFNSGWRTKSRVPPNSTTLSVEFDGVGDIGSQMGPCQIVGDDG